MSAMGLAKIRELVEAYAESYVEEVDGLLVEDDTLPLTTDQRDVVREEFYAASLGMIRQVAEAVSRGADLGAFQREFDADDDNDTTTQRHADGQGNTSNPDQ